MIEKIFNIFIDEYFLDRRNILKQNSLTMHVIFWELKIKDLENILQCQTK